MKEDGFTIGSWLTLRVQTFCFRWK